MNTTLNTKEASTYLSIAAYTLARWRALGQGPPYLKIGEGKQGAVRYLKEDLDKWLEERRVPPEVKNADG